MADKIEEMVTITKKKYDRLIKRDKELSRLEENGVDNWEGYSLGMDWEEYEDE